MASTEHKNAQHSSLRKQLAKLGRPKLAKKCQEQNLSIYGTKGDLIKRLISAMGTSLKRKTTERAKTQKKKKTLKRNLFNMKRNGSMDDKSGSNTLEPNKASNHRSSQSKPSTDCSSSQKKKRRMQSKTKRSRGSVVAATHPIRPSDTTKTKTKRKSKPKARRASIKTPDEEAESKPIAICSNHHNADKPNDAKRFATKCIYQIYNHHDRPWLNGKQCKLVETVDDDDHDDDEKQPQCKVTLLSNGSQQIIPRANLQPIDGNETKKTLQIPSRRKANGRRGSVDENKHIETEMQCIAPIDTDSDTIVKVYAVGVFVDYQMILKLWIDTNVALLFGTEYNDFKTECLTFLEQICHEFEMDVDRPDEKDEDGDDVKENDVQSDDGKHWKLLDGGLLFLHYVCNDKHIVLLTEHDGDADEDEDEDVAMNARSLSAISAIDCSIISGCNAYKLGFSGLEMIRKIFEMHDVYGFGEINQREFNNFLCALTVGHQIKSSSSEALFDEIDVDKIKAITFEQFATFMAENKQVLWKLLLELATDYELELNIKLEMYQNVLSKIHKLVLMMHEMSDSLSWRTARQHRSWQERMVPYIEFIKQGQQVIDRKMVHYRDHKKHNKRKSLESIAMFIHNNMPNID